MLNVFTLPPEILGSIFWWNTILEESKKRSYTFILVCHYWYEVAIRTPELWGFWGNTPSSWAKRHNKYPNVPLDLVLDGGELKGEPLDASVGNMLRDRASRHTIRLIHLRSGDSDLLRSILHVLAGDGKEVQRSSVGSFTLQIEGHGRANVAGFFAHNSFPKLRCLDLTNCTILPWDHLSSHATSLTTLILRLNTSIMPPSPRLLSFLAFNPALRKLILTGLSFSLNGGWNGDCPRVSLPHLEELDLSGESICVSTLLSKLDHPNLMRHVDITLTHCAAKGVSRAIGPYVRDYLRRRGRLGNSLGLGVSLKGRSLALHVDDADPLHPPTQTIERINRFLSIAINTNHMHPDESSEEVILDLIGYTPRDDIAYLRTYDNPVAMKNVYALLPNLVRLHSKGILLSDALPAINLDPVNRSLTHLRRVSFERLVVRDWIPLVTFLSPYVSSGRRLDSLEITTFANMPAQVEEKIRNLVGEFKLVYLR